MSGLSVRHPLLLGLLALVLAAYLAWRRWPPPLRPGHSRLAVGLRVAAMAMLVLALAGVRVVRRPDRRAVVAVVDLSDSARGTEEAAAGAVEALAAAKAPDDLLGIVTFGRSAQVEMAPTATPRFDGFQTRPDPSYSDIGAALTLAANLIPDGYGRQVVVLSDGRENLGDAAEAAARVRSQQVRVDVVILGAASGQEVTALSLDAPSVLRAGQAVGVTVRLRAAAPTDGEVALQVDGVEVARRPAGLPAGVSDHTFDLAPLEPGLHRLRAVVDAGADQRPQNNVAEAVVRVLGRPTVLVLEPAAGAAANVVRALAAAGMQPEVRRAEDAPTQAAELTRFDATVVVDVPADAIAAEAQAAIAGSVRDLGRGFVAVGGTTSYGPGGWQDTPLEEALPVRMEVPVPKQRPAFDVAILLETMEYPEGDLVALGATRSVIEQLTPQDSLAVVNMARRGSSLVVPLSPVTDPEVLTRRIRDTELGDPLGYGEALQMAVDALAAGTATTRHVVIMGDGDALADAAGYEAVLAGARARGITVTVVGVDTHASTAYMDHMKQLAQAGGGRFYLSRNATEVPEILLKASRSILRPWFEQEPFFPTVTSAGDLLGGVDVGAFPQLAGHVVTSPKATADVALSSPKGDPVLAGWQYGLGRSVAWTSDAAGRWTAGLLASPVGASLLARMVAWSFPVPSGEELTLDATPAGDRLDLSVTAPQPGGEVEVDVIGPNGTRVTERLRGVAPGRWVGQTRTSALGTYVLHGTLRRSGAVVAQAEVVEAVPYSPEYLALGPDDDLLRRISRPGGAVLNSPAQAWAGALPALSVPTEVFWALLLGALVLWPLDVAVRRLNLSLRQALSVLWSLVRFRRPAEVEVMVPASLTRLRARLDSHRGQRDEAAP